MVAEKGCGLGVPIIFLQHILLWKGNKENTVGLHFMSNFSQTHLNAVWFFLWGGISYKVREVPQIPHTPYVYFTPRGTNNVYY